MSDPRLDDIDRGRECIRAEIKRQMLGLGVPAGRVDEIVDLSIHAADEALRAAHRVLMAASTRDLHQTVNIGMDLLASHAAAAAAEARRLMGGDGPVLMLILDEGRAEG
jgi:hypothetical protein